jgi:hypothetical protein
MVEIPIEKGEIMATTQQAWSDPAEVASQARAERVALVVGRVVPEAPEPGAHALGRVVREAPEAGRPATAA